MENHISCLLETNGWHEDGERESCYFRTHRIDNYIWTECINTTSSQRVTYLQSIKQERSNLEKTIGAAADKYAHLAGELFASQVPFGRLGMKKLAAYSQGYELAKSTGKLLSQDVIDGDRLFMLVHQPLDLNAVITADSMPEAVLHVQELRRLSGIRDESA